MKHGSQIPIEEQRVASIDLDVEIIEFGNPDIPDT